VTLLKYNPDESTDDDKDSANPVQVQIDDDSGEKNKTSS